MKSRVRRLAWTMAGVVIIVGAGMGIAYAQQIWAGGYGYTPPRFPTKTSFTGGYTHCTHIEHSEPVRPRANASRRCPRDVAPTEVARVSQRLPTGVHMRRERLAAAV